MIARILGAWDPDLSVLIGCTALVAGYWAAHRGDRGRARWFVAGVGVMLLALISPLDTLGDEYLFSAHMLQHLLLVLVVPPLLLLGIGPRFARMVIEYRPFGALERILGNPVVALLLGLGMLTVWHVPALFDAALDNEYIHILEHLCFMVSATIFWWPILAPVPECRLEPLWMQLYLLAGAIANSLLGIWLTFAPAGTYAPYLHPSDSLQVLEALRSGWGLTPAIDQQVGGLLMWVGGGFVFVTVMVTKVVRWLGSVDTGAPSAAAMSD
jgi:cytochrome c oxidase assembly factor CtaG